MQNSKLQLKIKKFLTKTSITFDFELLTFNFRRSQTGQTLLELIIVMAISTIIIGALVFAIISSLRNTQFSKNQTQATKLAQEGVERLRSDRNRGAPIVGNFVLNSNLVDSWQDTDLWNNRISGNCVPNCYFRFDSTNRLQYLTGASDMPSNTEDPFSDGRFKRVVILSDDASTYTVQKTVTVIVRWEDPAGKHDSRLTTILRKI